MSETLNQRRLADLYVLRELQHGPRVLLGTTTACHIRKLSQRGLIDPAGADELNRRTYQINYNGLRFLSVGRSVG
jgi:hypothetical protein